MSEYLLGNPWEDQYYHIALAEHIKIYHNFAYVSLYRYAPLYHVLLASLSSISGVEIIYVACVLNLLVPVLLAIPVYLIATRIFKEKMVGVLSVAVLLTSVVITQSQLDPRQLSSVFFLLTMVLLLIFYTKKKLSRWNYLLLPITLFLLMVSHAEGFVRHLLVVFPMIVLLYLGYETRGPAFVRGRTKKLLALIGGFLILPFLIVLKDSFLISKIFVPYFTSSPLHSWAMPEVVSIIGPFVLALSFMGLVRIIFQRKENRPGAIFLLSWISITLLLAFAPIGMFLYRELYILVFPLSILTGYGIYGIYKAVKTVPLIKKFVLLFMIVEITLLLTIEITYKQANAETAETNRSFVESVVWAKANLDNGKVLGYHRVMWGIQTIFVGSELEPALPFGRLISTLENNLVYIEVMRGKNPADAMRRKNIRYVITTTWENYRRFMNDNFELIYDVKWGGVGYARGGFWVENRHIRIFELKGARG